MKNNRWWMAILLAAGLSAVFSTQSRAEEKIDRALWKIHSCSSAQARSGANCAANAIDGDPNTIWHTAYRPKAKPPPHEIVIDFGATLRLTGFSYIPRSEGANGVISDFACYVGDDPENWPEPAAKGRFFKKDAVRFSEKRVAFQKPISGRYLRLRSLSSVNDQPFTSAAEIGVFTGKFDPTALTPKSRPPKAICFALYTTQNNTLKMTAQLYPDGLEEDGAVALETKADGAWQEIAKAKPVLPGWSAHFRVENWDMTSDTPYRVRVGKETYEGVVRGDPVDKNEIVAAVFTGNSYSSAGGGQISKRDVVDYVNKIDADVLLFTGDQVYPHSNHTKWWLVFGESFGDIIRLRPTVCIPDDHDVGQPNIWGAGGRKSDLDTKGGYTKPVEYVHMVQRQQTSHLPDPYDPTPIKQGIAVYYTRMVVGGVDFAIIEDRKFKSGPYQFDTKGKGMGSRPDFIEVPDYDPADYDLPGLKLLGDRQLKFLDAWSRNWKGAVMKAVVSQTVFSQTSTNHGPNESFYYVDFDSNAWPQTGRNKALEIIRKCFAFHICGDQHLASVGQYGVDDWRDSGWWFCVPSISNIYPRRWAPQYPPVNKVEGDREYTGDYYDSLRNKMTIRAHTNPAKGATRNQPWGATSGKAITAPTAPQIEALNERMPGFGVVRFDKAKRDITMECWPRMTDPTDPASKQYEGWPRTITQGENYGRKAAAWLPEIQVKGMTNPVVRVIDQASGELVYTVRITGSSFRPKVFREGLYTVQIGELGSDDAREKKDIQSVSKRESSRLKIDL